MRLAAVCIVAFATLVPATPAFAEESDAAHVRDAIDAALREGEIVRLEHAARGHSLRGWTVPIGGVGVWARDVPPPPPPPYDLGPVRGMPVQQPVPTPAPVVVPAPAAPVAVPAPVPAAAPARKN